jgi:hypothetical protein
LENNAMNPRHPAEDRSFDSEAQSASHLPSESRRSTKSSSQLRNSESEMRELKNTGAGRYEKTSRETETSESRSRTSETFESGLLPPPQGSDSGQGNDSGGRVQEDWHDRVPPQVRISVDRVRSAGEPDAPMLSGDYILALEHRSSLQCRWNLVFPQRCGLSGMTCIATPASDGQLELQVFFTGSVAGPTWRAHAPRIESLLLEFAHGTAANPCAGCLWPDSVLLTALGTPSQQERFYISPEPTAAQRAMMAAAGDSGSSCGCSSSGECPPCPPPEPPCDGELECCPQDGGAGTRGTCSGATCPAPVSSVSDHPVRYANGELQLSVSDVSASGFGQLLEAPAGLQQSDVP